MKIFAGIYPRDGGQIIFKGQEVDIPNPHAAQEIGISMVHQELNLMPHLTAAHNIFIGREPRNSMGLFLDENRINQQAQDLFDMMNLDVNPRVKVSDMSVAKQQMVEIAKALSFNAEVMVFDEPTSPLTDVEITELFRIIKELRGKGVGIIYITHRLEELKQISDRHHSLTGWHVRRHFINKRSFH